MANIHDNEIDRLIALHEASWQRGYHKFPAVLKKLGLKRGAEIGVAFGGHAQAMFEQGDIDMLYAVDSYRHRPEYDDPMNLPQPVFDRLFERTGDRLSRVTGQCIQIRKDSVDAAPAIDELLDFVYIDGDHSYQGIREDLEAWLPKVRVGGIIAGHDYGQPAFPGVKAVVDAFFARFGITVHDEGAGCWWALRPATPIEIVIPLDEQLDVDPQDIAQQLATAGMAEGDGVVLVGPSESLDRRDKALDTSASLRTIATEQAVGPWQATRLAAASTKCPLTMPIELGKQLNEDVINALRQRVVTSGARVATVQGEQTHQDVGLRMMLGGEVQELAYSQTVFFTSAWRDAEAELSKSCDPSQLSDRGLAWCITMLTLADGGRLAIDPGQTTPSQTPWTVEECRAAAKTLCLSHTRKLSVLDVLHLKRPDTASSWLNQLNERPMQLLPSVRPTDHPALYIAPNLIDRLFHKVRRGIQQVA